MSRCQGDRDDLDTGLGRDLFFGRRKTLNLHSKYISSKSKYIYKIYKNTVAPCQYWVRVTNDTG